MPTEQGNVMRAVIVYESIYGNTHDIAEAIAAGLRVRAEVSVLPVRNARHSELGGIDLLVVGGPTHAWGMTRSKTREQAITDGVRKGLRTEAQHGDPGLREWLTGISATDLPTAAFDTRIKAPSIVTGGATRGIRRRLRRNGLPLITKPASFFVNRDNQLLEGETDRARRWGSELGELAAKPAQRRTGQPSRRASRAAKQA
jgi:Flavodoxin domain